MQTPLSALSLHPTASRLQKPDSGHSKPTGDTFSRMLDEAKAPPKRREEDRQKPEDHAPDLASEDDQDRPERAHKDDAKTDRPAPLVGILSSLPHVDLAALEASAAPKASDVPELPDVGIRRLQRATEGGPRLRLDAPPAEAQAAAAEGEAVEQSALSEEVQGDPLWDAPVEPVSEEGSETPKSLWLGNSEAHPIKMMGPHAVAAPLPAEGIAPELAAPLPDGLHLEIQDPAGRWELSVSRVDGAVQMEFGGDDQLRQLISSSTRDIADGLARHGDTLGAVHWRPLVQSQNADGQFQSFSGQNPRQDTPSQQGNPQFSQDQGQDQGQGQGQSQNQGQRPSQPEKPAEIRKTPASSAHVLNRIA